MNTTLSPKLSTKVLVLGGVSVALAFILSYLKLFHLPQGGSVTLGSMLPIIFYAFICGPIAGTIAGVAFGILQFLQDAYAAHWLSILLDYPLAFGVLGIAGFVPLFFKTKKNKRTVQFILATLLAIIGRFIMHFISGAVFFGMYAPKGINPWLYSLGYNFSYLSIETLITCVIGIFLLASPLYKKVKETVSR
jgi:thiamine transporter